MPRIFHAPFWIAALLLVLPAMMNAQQASKVVGRIVAVKVVGTVTVTDGRDPMHPHKLVERGEVTEGQIISTGEDSRVILVFSNGATVNLGAKSMLKIDDFLQDPFSQPVKVSELIDEPTTSITRLNLLRGEMMSNVKHLRRDKGSVFEVATPVGAAGIRGTTFQVIYRPSGNFASYALRMVEGKIAMDFGGRSRNVDVEKDQQVAIEGIQLDASGRVIALPVSIKVTEIPESLKASLAAAAQSLIDATATMDFQAMKAAETPQQAYPQSTGSSANSDTDSSASNTTASSNVLPLSPVPPAVPPAPRTTPGDGAL